MFLSKLPMYNTINYDNDNNKDDTQAMAEQPGRCGDGETKGAKTHVHQPFQFSELLE